MASDPLREFKCSSDGPVVALKHRSIQTKASTQTKTHQPNTATAQTHRGTATERWHASLLGTQPYSHYAVRTEC